MMLKVWEYRKFEGLLFVDTENVGYLLTESLPRNVCVFLFISQPALLKKMKKEKCFYGKWLEVIDMTYISHKKLKRNAMDFCMVAQLSMLISWLSSKQKIVILSKDKGYESMFIFLS